MAQVADLMTPDVLTVAPEDTLGEAAEKMAAASVGSAVVVDYGRLIGILTERDILEAVAGRVHSSEARVREWMTKDPVTTRAETSVEDAARMMLEGGFRHLPVLDGDELVGIASLRDVLRWTAAVASGERTGS